MSDVRLAVISAHVTERSHGHAGGRVVVSTLDQGDSLVYCPSPSVKLVLDGEERYENDGRIHIVRAGQFLLADAGWQLRAIVSRRAPAVGVCIYLPFDALPEASEERVPLMTLSAAGSRFGDYLLATARQLAVDPGARSALAGDLVAAARGHMPELIGGAEDSLSRLGRVKVSTQIDNLRRVEEARAYLHAHGDRIVTLTELARAVGVSRFYLARNFRAAYAQSPIAYHRQLRLADAVERIRARDWTATAAAEALGFSDLPSFSRAVRRKYGVPPGRLVGPAEGQLR